MGTWVATIAAFAALFLLNGCSLSKDGGARTTNSSAVAAVGRELWQKHCASCHGPLGTDPRFKDRTWEELSNAIQTIPAMQFLSSGLSDKDLQDIAAALASPPDTTAPSVPLSVTASALGPTSVAVGWLASSDETGGTGVTGYHVLRNGVVVGSVESAVSYVDSGLTPDTEYRYEVQAFDGANNLSSSSASAAVRTGRPPVVQDTTPPQQPTGLVVTVKSPSRIEITWGATSDNDGGTGLNSYRIYRNNVVVKNVPASDLLYLDVFLNSATSYTYHVTAVDNAGNESVKSEGSTRTTMAAASGAVLFANRCANCHQQQEMRNKSAALMEEKIFSSVAMEGVRDLGPDEIAAIALAFSDASDRTPPSKPTGLSAIATSASTINLNWTASTDSGISGLRGYRVYRNGTEIALVTTTSHSDSGLSAATSYTYTVKSVDNAGNLSSASDAVTATTIAAVVKDVLPPSVPSGVVATALGSSSIQITWRASTDNVGVVKYRVYRNNVPLRSDVNAPNLSVVDAGLVASTAYTYKVSALDAANLESEVSAAVSATTQAPDGRAVYDARCKSCHGSFEANTSLKNKSATQLRQIIDTDARMASVRDITAAELAALARVLLTDTIKPGAPTGLTATAVSPVQINLSWNAAVDNAGGSGIQSYKIFRSGTVAPIQTVSASIRSFADTARAPLTTYTYHVVAVDYVSLESTASAQASATTPASNNDVTPPTAPATLTASAAAYNRVTLSWAKSTDDIGVVKYRVFRNNVFLVDVTAPVTTHVDTTVLGLATYSYTVKALDSVPRLSIASNVANVTTPAPDPVAVYNARCAGCHLSLMLSVNDDPQSLRGRFTTTAAFMTAFNNAIRPVDLNLSDGNTGGVLAMQAQKNLSQPEKDALARLLSVRIDPNPDPDDDSVWTYWVPVPQRQYLASLYYQVFVNPTAPEQGLADIVTKINNNAPALGGSCSRYDKPNCAVIPSTHPQYLNAPASPHVHAPRMGYLINACAQLLETSSATTNALARAGLTTASTALGGNLVAVYRLFLPYRTPPVATVNALAALHADALARSMNTAQAWRLVLLALCEAGSTGGF